MSSSCVSRSHFTATVITSIILASTCAAQVAAGAETRKAPVVYSEAPRLSPRSLHLEEIWRVGGEDGEDAEVLFGLMIAAVADAEGNVYLMDQQLCEVTVVSPTGIVLRTIAGEGDGPGEVRTPQGIVLLDDGRIGLAQQFPGKFITLSPQGDPAATITVSGGPDPEGGYTYIAGCRQRAGQLVIAGQYSAPVEHGQSRVSYLASLTPTGEEAVRFREMRGVFDFRKAHLVEGKMAPAFHIAATLGPAGRVYCARSRDSYAIEVFRPDGSCECIIERAFESRERDPDELRRWNALFEVQARNLPFDITWEVDATEPDIAELNVAQDGTLWVQHSRSGRDQPPGVFMSYDTFDPDGRYRQEVRVTATADPDQDGLIFLDDGRVLLVEGLVLARLTATGSQGAVFGEEDESGPMVVRCCRLVD